MKENNENYTPMLAAACLEVLTLHLLKQKPMYTYELANEIEEVSHGQLTAPKLYNTMLRLRTAALVEECDQKIVGNRVRVYYTLTRKGEERLQQCKDLLRFLTEIVKSE